MIRLLSFLFALVPATVFAQANAVSGGLLSGVNANQVAPCTGVARPACSDGDTPICTGASWSCPSCLVSTRPTCPVNQTAQCNDRTWSCVTTYIPPPPTCACGSATYNAGTNTWTCPSGPGAPSVSYSETYRSNVLNNYWIVWNISVPSGATQTEVRFRDNANTSWYDNFTYRAGQPSSLFHSFVATFDWGEMSARSFVVNCWSDWSSPSRGRLTNPVDPPEPTITIVENPDGAGFLVTVTRVVPIIPIVYNQLECRAVADDPERYTIYNNNNSRFGINFGVPVSSVSCRVVQVVPVGSGQEGREGGWIEFRPDTGGGR